MTKILSRAAFEREQPEAAAYMDRVFGRKPTGPSIMRDAHGRLSASHVRASNGQSDQGARTVDAKALAIGLRAVVGSGRDIRPALRRFIDEIERSASMTPPPAPRFA